MPRQSLSMYFRDAWVWLFGDVEEPCQEYAKMHLRKRCFPMDMAKLYLGYMETLAENAFKWMQ